MPGLFVYLTWFFSRFWASILEETAQLPNKGKEFDADFDGTKLHEGRSSSGDILEGNLGLGQRGMTLINHA
jgi:hypothetical protein